MSTPLESLRGQLDEVDDAVVDLLARRAKIVAEIWAWKRTNAVAQIDPARELALRERLRARATHLGLSAAAVDAVFDQIIGRSLR